MNWSEINWNLEINVEKYTPGSEITKLIEKKAGFLTRWGVTILYVMIFMVVYAAWVIEYPRKITLQGIVEIDSMSNGCHVEVVGSPHLFSCVKIGQDVPIILENFSEEGGKKKGRVTYLSTSTTNTTTCKISLTNGLTADSIPSVPCQRGLVASVEFEGGNQRLVEIVFKEFYQK